MVNQNAHPVVREITERYLSRTSQSRRHLEAAKQWLPGGETRQASFYKPYPTIMTQGERCYLYDCDGHSYMDFQNNYTSLIHGHCHPAIVSAASAQLKKGAVLGTATELQYLHAAHLCKRIPSLEMVRYCNCGTEATLFALRASRAFTGRHAILKMDGGYHGGHEFVQVNYNPNLNSEDSTDKFADPWIPKGVFYDVFIVPFNDLKIAEDIIQKHRQRLAAVIVEPSLGAGGQIGPGPGYLKGLRELTAECGVLLIFDEIMSFRHHVGGMQASEGVEPDLTALGKIIGGGFPVGAFGGRAEIMDLFNPDHAQSIFHSGTFSGNSVTMAAGLTALELYDHGSVEQLNSLADKLKQGFRDAFQRIGIKGQITGCGSVFNVHWVEREPQNAKDTAKASRSAGPLPALFHLEMMNRGIHIAPRGMFALSTPMTENEVNTAIKIFEDTLKYLKPFVEDQLPQLLQG